jgi:GT2 family glycosyltransferase
MDVSVIVSNFNGAKFLPRLIESLQAQAGVTPEILIVDRYSTDETPAILARHPGLKVVKEPPESGLAAGYAAGVPHARYELLFFCNEDMWFAPDCLQRLAAAVDLSRRVGCADPWQWSYDGSRLVHTGPQVRRQWNRGSPHPFYDLPQNEHLPSGHVVAQASAGAMLVHRAVYEEVGGWDRTFFLDHEDTDLAIRMWQRGWLSVVVPEAKVYHAIGASNTQVIPTGRVSVGKKRYVESASNQFAVVWKLFSPRLALLPFLPWLEKLSKNLLRGRWRHAGWDVLSLKSALARIPAILAFRRRNRSVLRERPGEQFFRQAMFQFGTLQRP